MKQQQNNTTETTLTRYNRNGREVVRIPHGFMNGKGPSGFDISRLANPRDLAHIIEYRLAEMMGTAGFSYKAIGKVLGLTKNDIAHRLKRVGVKVRDYRDGESALAGEVIARLADVAQRRMVNNLGELLLK